MASILCDLYCAQCSVGRSVRWGDGNAKRTNSKSLSRYRRMFSSVFFFVSVVVARIVLDAVGLDVDVGQTNTN